MRVMSYALYWRANSRYEHPNAGIWTGFKFYPSFLPTLVRAHHVVFPDYELRLHHDGCLETCYYGAALKVLARRGLVTLVNCGHADSLCGPMLWRLLPAWDDEVDYVFSRDVDALPMPRERAAIETFIASEYVAQALYDSPAHGGGLCGGLVGFQAAGLRRIKPTFESLVLQPLMSAGPGIDLDVPGADQDLLNASLLPALGPGLLRQRDLPRGDGLDRLAPHLGMGYSRAPVIEFCQGQGRTAEIEEVEALTGTPPLIEQWRAA